MRLLPYEQVKEFINNEGYTLIDNKYINGNTELKLQCPNGHLLTSTFFSFKNAGKRCDCQHQLHRKNLDEVRMFISNQGDELLSTSYSNSHGKLEIKCKCGNIFRMCFHTYQQGQRCGLHKGERISNSKKHNISYIRECIKKEGYTLLSEDYKNGFKKIKLQCPHNHIYNARWNNFQQGKRCPVCAQKYSRVEKSIVSYIHENYNYDVVENDRTQVINPLTKRHLELDIYIPKLNKAIEYNGKYWHSSDYSKIKDNIKKKQCNKMGIDLLVIMETDWNKDFSIIDNFIKGDYRE